MKKKHLLVWAISLLLVSTSFSVKIYADEEPVQPQQPVIENVDVEQANQMIEQYNQEVETYNEQVDQYNQNVDEKYEQDFENYKQEAQNVADHNIAEDEKVAQVEAHNKEEDEKLVKSQEELAAIEAKVEADQPGSTVENFTTNPEDLPTDWSDTSEELHTIKIEEAEEKSGEEISIINLHLYLDADQAPNEIFIGGNQLTNDQFLLTDELKSCLLFAEWEVATFDLNDRVIVSSEAEIYKDGRIRHDGKNYKMQDYNANFIRNVEDYTQGTWMASSEVASNSNTMEYGWGYDFETQTGKGGETYTFEFTPEETTQYYLDNGELKSETVITRTIDKSEPKNILSIFTYLFQRIWDEPVEYEPEYQEYTPEYLDEPEAPIKGEYLEKLEPMDLIETEEQTPNPEPTPDPDPVPVNPTPVDPTPIIVEPETPEPVVEEITERTITEEIIEDEVPLTAPLGQWALINLISTILSVIIALLMLITLLKKEKHYDENDEEQYKRLYSKITGVLPAILSVILFIMTEDMRNPMVLIDKWTLPMLLILLISIALSYITRRQDEKEKDEKIPS